MSTTTPIPAPSFRKDLQPDDSSRAARAYRGEFQYFQEAIIKALDNLDDDDKYERLLEMTTGRLENLKIGERPTDKATKVQLAIFGCEVLLLPNLFTHDNDVKDKKSWLRKEMRLLRRLKDRLEKPSKEKLATAQETAFLSALEEDPVNPYQGGHDAWLMDLVVTVKSVRDFKP